MIRHYPVFLFFTISVYLIAFGCNTSKKIIQEDFTKKTILRTIDWSGRKILFVVIGDKYKSVNNINKKFSLLNVNDHFINYSKLENQHGKILGEFFRNGSEYLLIEMKDGEKIKYERTNWEKAENRPPPYCCFIEELTKTKNMIGQTIWLNKTTNFLYTSTTSFFTYSNKKFNRFDEVVIVDIYPFYNGGFDRPLWLMIKSKDEKIGYVKYNYKERTKGYINNYYYRTDPLPKEWSDEIIKIIKKERICVGMTAKQVRISWGNPSQINKIITENGKIEKWIYNNSNPDVVYINNGIVKSIQN